MTISSELCEADTQLYKHTQARRHTHTDLIPQAALGDSKGLTMA